MSEQRPGSGVVGTNPARVEGGIATLGGGCFWCLEAVFEQLSGVERVESGYSGGTRADSTYSQVSRGTTGHAEVVQITYDPSTVSYRDLLQVFFKIHDPTQVNRQGGDIGAQYRSVVYCHSSEQRALAEKVMGELGQAEVWGSPIVTELAPFSAFYLAEGYHQEYYRRNRGQAYCRVVIEPKVAKFRQKYMSRLKAGFAQS